MSVESVMPSNQLILCCPLRLLPSIFPSIRIFSNDLALRIGWPKYRSFIFSINPFNEYSGLISFRTDWFWSPFCPSNFQEFQHQEFQVFSNTTVQKHQFFSSQPSLWSNFHICTQLLEMTIWTFVGKVISLLLGPKCIHFPIFHKEKLRPKRVLLPKVLQAHSGLSSAGANQSLCFTTCQLQYHLGGPRVS